MKLKTSCSLFFLVIASCTPFNEQERKNDLTTAEAARTSSASTTDSATSTGEPSTSTTSSDTSTSTAATTGGSSSTGTSTTTSTSSSTSAGAAAATASTSTSGGSSGSGGSTGGGSPLTAGILIGAGPGEASISAFLIHIGPASGGSGTHTYTVYRKSTAFSSSTVSAIEAEGTLVTTTTNTIFPVLVPSLSINTSYYIAAVVEDSLSTKAAYSAITQATNQYRTIFPIPIPGSGFTSGPSAADSACQTYLPNSGLMTAKALLTDGDVGSPTRVACTSANCATSGNSEHVDWVLAASTTYQNSDGNTIGTTTAIRIFNFSITANLTTAFSPATGLIYWFSGFSSSGTPNDWTTGSTCSGWTSTSSGNSADAGSFTATNDTSISNGTHACDQTGFTGAGILCVEQ